MRIQILPLPAVTVGAFSNTPFAVVVDRADDDTPLSEALIDSFLGLKDAIGAASVLVVDGDLDVGSPLELTEDQRDQIAAHIDEKLARTR